MIHIVELGKSLSVLHPILAEIRDVKTQTDRMRFRRNMERAGEIMAYEISKNMNYKEIEVETPLEKTFGYVPEDSIVLATILRAGLPLHQGLLNVFDKAESAFASAYRKYHNEEEFTIETGYISCPNLDGKLLILSDPMLATARSIIKIYRALKSFGTPKETHIVSLIAAKPGVDYLINEINDNITLWVAAIDPGLNHHAYIVPGLGDAGDLAYGDKL